MALKSDFNEAKNLKEMQRFVESVYDRIVIAFQRAGERFIVNARDQPQNRALGFYLDQTANLRNSIGYYLYHDGTLIKENSLGNAILNKVNISDLIQQSGYQLIGIAGMNYASHVESKGYNVISIQSDICIVDLTKYFKDIEIYVNGLL